MQHKVQKVIIVAGTRPEAIKLVPLILAFQANPRMEAIVVSTGQHTQLVREVLAAANLTPDVELDAATPGNTLNQLFASIVTRFEKWTHETFGVESTTHGYSPRPEQYPVACFVHGDTTSAAAAALAAFHLRIPVVHVEAGLRTSDTLSPFPEEANRQLISRLAALHLAPTGRNKSNLVREGVPYSRVLVCGNTAVDALQWAAGLERPYGAPELADLEHDEDTRVVVVTAHRRENWGAGLHRIGTAVAELASAYPQVRFIVPLHPNPSVQATLRPLLESRANVDLIEPMAYGSFARLLRRATFAITDSGGIQEEAPALGTPVLVVRDTTERQEGVDAGTLELVGTDSQRIVASASRLLDDNAEYERRRQVTNPYGDGHTSRRIVEACMYIAFGSDAPDGYGSGIDRTEILRSAGFIADPMVFTQLEAQLADDLAQL